MRITILTPPDCLTGGIRVIAIYARKLVELGHDVLVVSCAPDRAGFRDILKNIFRGEPLPARRNGTDRPGHLAISGVPMHVLERPRPIVAGDVPDADIIIATWWETAAWMHAMPQSKGRRVHLIQGYEIWGDPQAAEKVHAVLRLPNLKIAISSNLKETIETRAGVQGISVIPNAVDLEQFDSPGRERQQTPAVGFVYAAAAFKGVDICIQACRIARREIPSLRVLSFGADEIAPELPLPEGAIYAHRPPQESLRNIYGSCDAWLFGSRLDSFGLPMLEAMACRTPVIAVPVGAAEELLGDGNCGTIVPPESPEAMAAAIVETCRLSGDAWKARSTNAYERAHSYSWDDATRRLLELVGTGR